MVAESVKETDSVLLATLKTVLVTRSRLRSVVIKIVPSLASGVSGAVAVKVAEVVDPVPDDDFAQLERPTTASEMP